MRKLVWMMSVSLDGYFEGPDHELDWHMVDDELHRHFNAELATMGAFLDGRVTYELMAGFWPTADADPSSGEPVAEVAREEIQRLKAEPGGDLVLGGAQLAATFLRLDLIDEYRVYVHPVVIGRGRPMFPASHERLDLRLAEARSFGNGVVLLRYERPGSRA